ncbi:MAG: DNA polymerase III subunit delta [Rickettsiales bacterium]|jgi:DNA polymerase-3 subunit delta|nr:DNA polymerase III subunit delta [Rickettsiales bacterium]
MEVKPENLAQYAASGMKGVRGVLFYGPDRSKGAEYMAEAERAALPDGDDGFSLFEFPASAVQGDPAALSDEMAAISFASSRKVVKVRDATAETVPAIQGALASGSDALLLVLADDIGKSSPLVRLFAGAEDLLAVPGYNDDARSLDPIVRKALSDAGIVRVPPDVVRFISSRLGESRATTRAELEKLCLYLHGEKEISLDDAKKCLIDSSLLKLEDLGFCVAEGNAAALSVAMERLFGGGADPNEMLGAALRHFKKLYFMSLDVEGGKSVGAVAMAEFWKVRDRFERQLRMHNSKRLEASISRLVDAQAQCRTTGMPAEAIARQALLSLCYAAGRRQ